LCVLVILFDLLAESTSYLWSYGVWHSPFWVLVNSVAAKKALAYLQRGYCAVVATKGKGSGFERPVRLKGHPVNAEVCSRREADTTAVWDFYG